MGRAGRIIAMAAAHHRFNYIHPFPDGHGRVSRLMSHAMAWHADIAAHGLWSISRGLARGLESRAEYKQMMDMADTPRQNDLDGRGNLSERALIDFVVWFLRVALDQVTFMSDLFDLDNLTHRLRNFVERDGQFKPEAAALLSSGRGRTWRGISNHRPSRSDRAAPPQRSGARRRALVRDAERTCVIALSVD